MGNRKKTYEALLKENEALKNELAQYYLSEIEHHNFIDNIRFEDLFNNDEIQQIQDLFSEATGVASVITDPQGIPLTKPSNFCSLCRDVIRKTEKGLQNCYRSDAAIGKRNEKGPIYQPCLSGGLWDAGASIIVGGKHIANWLIGQVKNSETDVERMMQYAQEIGADEEEFKKALDNVPVMSTEKFKKVADTLYYFANEISSVVYQNLEKVQLIKKLKDKEDQLTKAKNAVEQNRNYLRSIINSIPDLVWLKDVNGVYMHCNTRFEKLFDTLEKDLIGKTDYDFVDKATADFFSLYDKKAIEAGKLSINEEEVIFKNDGHKELLETVKTPVFDNSGNVIGVLGIGRNILNRKKREKELKEAKRKAEESDRLKTEFINNMSHEIRTPMNGIIGFSNFLTQENLPKERQIQYINIIQSSSQRLLHIIDDILEISRIETGIAVTEQEQTNLNDVLLELFLLYDMKAKENEVPLYLNKGFSDKDSNIYTDELKLKKIIGNLLENAIKFTPEGYIEFGYTLENEQLRIYVKDTGVGISEGHQNSIFKRFSQGDNDDSKFAGGLGLGLSIAKENTQLLGGTISFESEINKGTTFFVEIPYKPYITAGDENISTDDINASSDDSFSVLIVEDEEINFMFIETLLDEIQDYNIRMVHARNGKIAVETCESDKEIDIVLMDIKMPVMNGIEATKLIKKSRPNLPIIAQTAFSTNSDLDKIMDAGCDDYIVKPIQEQIFREKLFSHLKFQKL